MSEITANPEAVAVSAAVVDRHAGDAVGIQHHAAAAVAGVLVRGDAVPGSGQAAAESSAYRGVTALLIRRVGVERAERRVMGVVTARRRFAGLGDAAADLPGIVDVAVVGVGRRLGHVAVIDLQRVAQTVVLADRHGEIEHRAIVGAAPIVSAIGRQRGGDVADPAEVEQLAGRHAVAVLRACVPVSLV